MTVTDEMVRAGIAAMLAAIYDDLPADMTLEEGQPHAMRSALEAALAHYQDSRVAKLEAQVAALRWALSGLLRHVEHPGTTADEVYLECHTRDVDYAFKALSNTAKDHDARVRAIAWDTGDAEEHEMLADVAQAIRSLSNQEAKADE